MADATRYTKTDKAIEEIHSRGKHLRGRMRTMLFLIEPSKTVDELSASAAQIGVEPDFLETLIRDGYVIAVAANEGGPAQPAPRAVTREHVRLRAAKSFLNETLVDALGIRAFLFTRKLERCSTREELAALLPDYAKAIGKIRGASETRLLVERASELLS